LDPPLRLLLGALLAAAVCGCGGEKIVDTSQGEAPLYDPCEDSASLEKAVVDDFESMPVVSFFASSDGTSTDVTPPSGSTTTTPLEASKCASDATPGSGFHVVARGLQAYGYTFGFNTFTMLPGGGGQSYFDISNWDGLSMWVRKGKEAAASSFFASVADRYTSPMGGSLFTPAEAEELLGGAYCGDNASDVNNDGTPDPLRSQCDRFGVGIGIATEWRFFRVPFSRMRQRAYGRPSALSVPDSKIIGLNFEIRGDNLDFWIDDVAFYRERGQ
jgi:hypothetical protein